MSVAFDRLRGVVADNVLDVVEAVAEVLRNRSDHETASGIHRTQEPVRFALCGALAVSAHGYVRATRNVDFLVSDEAFEVQGRMVLMRFPIVSFKGVSINFVRSDEVTDKELRVSTADEVVPIVSPEVLAYMKLKAGRMRDTNDLFELVRLGKLDGDRILKWLDAKAPAELSAKWVWIVNKAAERDE
jgi:hypothetical protein